MKNKKANNNSNEKKEDDKLKKNDDLVNPNQIAPISCCTCTDRLHF